MHVKLMKDVPFKIVAHRVNMRYSKRETVELVQNEGSDLEDFSEWFLRTLLILARSLCQKILRQT